MRILACHCSCPDADTAGAIATVLVEERLAACATVQPGLSSVYRWQGRVERAGEVLLVAKTTDACLDALVARVRALHPYEVPEIIAMEVVGGLPAYLAWVQAETEPPPEG